MVKDGLVQWVQTLNVAELLKYPKEELEALLGKDFAVMKGYSQNNPHHCYDLLEHTIKTAEALDCTGLGEIEAQELMIAALFHDVGKPIVALEKNGHTVFYNHAAKSREIAEQELIKHNLGKCSFGKILFYIEHHDDFISFKLKMEVKGNKNPFVFPIAPKSVHNRIRCIQEDCTRKNIYVPDINGFMLLMRLCIADAKAQSLRAIQAGKVIDSMENKLARLNAIAAHIRVIQMAEVESADWHANSAF